MKLFLLTSYQKLNNSVNRIIWCFLLWHSILGSNSSPNLMTWASHVLPHVLSLTVPLQSTTHISHVLYILKERVLHHLIMLPWPPFDAQLKHELLLAALASLLPRRLPLVDFCSGVV